MSLLDVQGAVLARLATISPDLPTAQENAEFAPPQGQPYQRATFLMSAPANDEMSASYREQGTLQVDLFYPANTDAGAAKTRAALIRDTFPRGLSLTQGGIVTTIDRTPEIATAYVDGDRFCVPVRIRFRSQITA